MPDMAQKGGFVEETFSRHENNFKKGCQINRV
jgi:hypothetical protein